MEGTAAPRGREEEGRPHPYRQSPGAEIGDGGRNCVAPPPPGARSIDLVSGPETRPTRRPIVRSEWAAASPSYRTGPTGIRRSGRLIPAVGVAQTATPARARGHPGPARPGLRDFATGEERRRVSDPTDGLRGVAFALDGRMPGRDRGRRRSPALGPGRPPRSRAPERSSGSALDLAPTRKSVGHSDSTTTVRRTGKAYYAGMKVGQAFQPDGIGLSGSVLPE